MRSIAVGIFHVLSLLAFCAGLMKLFTAAIVPSNYVLSGASAVQVTQVYSEATYTVLIAMAFFVCGASIQLMLYLDDSRRHHHKMESRLKRMIDSQAE
jgi:hypothetical protein